MIMMGTHQQDPCSTTPPSGNSSSSTTLKAMRTTQRGGTSESSTTSDNTTDFIEIVKKHDVVYNTHHPDYKNVEVKLKVWTIIAKEIGLSVDASKRKWKNLRDSYTKYLRSFRVGSKTSKKYQFWAHADHMEFLKPYQGPGRSNNGVMLPKDEEETECDLGFQVLTKATSNSTDDDVKQTTLASSNPNIFATSLASVLPNFAAAGAASIGGGITTSSLGLTTTTSSSAGGTNGYATSGPLVLPVPSLPTVQLPPSLTAKPILSGMSNVSTCSSSSSTAGCSIALSTPSISTSNSTTPLIPSSMASLTPSSMASQVFALPQLSAKGTIPMPASNTASSVGCLIIEPQLFASADTFKKEFGNAISSCSSSTSSTTCTTQMTPSNLHIYPNISAQVTPASTANAANNNRLNPPLITKIRRVQPSPHQTTPAAINLSFSSAPAPVISAPSSSLSSLAFSAPPNGFFSTAPNLLPNFGANFGVPNLGSTTITTSSNGPTPAKRLKSAEVEISAILQANRDLDANTLFFLSLARSVRSMPTKFQSLAKMRCMRIVSDIELELDNCDSGEANGHNNTKYCTNNSDSPPPSIGSHINEPPQSEHFVYVMSPSRVESMIDLSSDDENTQSVNGGTGSGGGGIVGGNGVVGPAN